MGEWCRASDAEPLQAALGEVHTRGRTQDDARVAPTESDERDLVATDVGMPEQGQDRALGGEHALLRVHRGGGVDHEDDQVASLALANFLAQILALQLELVDGIGRGQPAAELMRRSRSDGRIERDIGDLLRLRTAHVAPTLRLALRRGPLARRASRLPLAWQVQLLDSEGPELNDRVRFRLDRLVRRRLA